MNEKIKSLLNVCGMPNEDLMELYEDKNKTFYMEKFAELIIQECHRASENYINECGEVNGVPESVFKTQFGIEWWR